MPSLAMIGLIGNSYNYQNKKNIIENYSFDE